MNIVSYNEAELKHKWAERQRSADDDNDVSTEVSVWPTGTRIDVVVSNHAGKFDIYELKARKADPQDLYQLRMYWDGLVLSGVQPTRGTLVAPSYSDNLQKMLQMVNELPPPNFPDGPSEFEILLHVFDARGKRPCMTKTRGGVMMLDAIFDGTFNPSELRIQNSEKFTQACKNAERLQMQLSMQLCDEDYALVEDLTNELLNSCEANAGSISNTASRPGSS